MNTIRRHVPADVNRDDSDLPTMRQWLIKCIYHRLDTQALNSPPKRGNSTLVLLRKVEACQTMDNILVYLLHNIGQYLFIGVHTAISPPHLAGQHAHGK